MKACGIARLGITRFCRPYARGQAWVTPVADVDPRRAERLAAADSVNEETAAIPNEIAAVFALPAFAALIQVKQGVPVAGPFRVKSRQ